jgi:hypothetical protein
MKRQEGVGIKIRGWLRSNRSMKISRIEYYQVYPDLYITDCKGNYREMSGVCCQNTGNATLTACKTGSKHALFVLKVAN